MPTILITGAGRGLGLELARQYAADGWRVIGSVRDAAGKARLKKLGAETLELDVSDPPKLKKSLSSVKDPIDLLFCNAGIIGKRGSALGSFDYADWESVLRVNLLGAAATVEALLGNVASSERRTIALMSSRLGSIAEAGGMTVPYSTSKAALNMLSKSMSELLKGKDIIVVAVSPGWVRTDMGGAGAPLSPEDSVRGLRKVLAGVRPQDSGRFFSHDGSAIPW